MNQKILSKNNPQRRTCQLLLAITLVISNFFIFVVDCLAQHNYPLIDSSNFQYIGAFKLPQIKSDTGFSYGGSAMTYNPYRNSLILVGHVNRQEVAEVLIPQDDSIILLIKYQI